MKWIYYAFRVFQKHSLSPVFSSVQLFLKLFRLVMLRNSFDMKTDVFLQISIVQDKFIHVVAQNSRNDFISVLLDSIHNLHNGLAKSLRFTHKLTIELFNDWFMPSSPILLYLLDTRRLNWLLFDNRIELRSILLAQRHRQLDCSLFHRILFCLNQFHKYINLLVY